MPLLIAVFTCLLRVAPAQLPAPNAVRQLMERVADYQLAHQVFQPVDNEWYYGAFYAGIMSAYRSTGKSKYLDEATSWSAAFNYSPPNQSASADDQCCGQTHLELYALSADPAMLLPIKESFDALAINPPEGRVAWYWCDSYFMAPPTLARLAEATSDTRYLTLMNQLFWNSKEFLYDPAEGLFYRDQNFFSARTVHGAKVFWSRGNGWVLAGIARVLEKLPRGAPRRDEYVSLFTTMAASVARVQGEDGLWRTSLLDTEEYPVKESSGTAFFCFALAWGINEGLLSRSDYLPTVQKAWAGLETCVDADGKMGYVQPPSDRPAPVVPGNTREYAVGALLLAGSEVAKLAAAPSRIDNWELFSE